MAPPYFAPCEQLGTIILYTNIHTSYIYCNNSISIITLLSYCVSSFSPPTDSLTNVLQTTTYFYTIEMFALDNTSAANQEVGRILETMLRLVGVFFQTLNFFKNSITYMLFVMYLFISLSSWMLQLGFGYRKNTTNTSIQETFFFLNIHFYNSCMQCCISVEFQPDFFFAFNEYLIYSVWL